MSEDPRCCGSGTCVINNEGRCWCGQQWDGETMCSAGQSAWPLPTVQAHHVDGKGPDCFV